MEDHELQRLKDSKKMACDGWAYAIQRMDLLIISISSAGIYVVLETLKYTFEHHINNVVLLKIAGILFVSSIVINFSSQWTGRNCNLNHIKWVDAQIVAGKKPTLEQQTEITILNYNASTWDKFTNIFNLSSLILMISGLILIMIYFLVIL